MDMFDYEAQFGTRVFAGVAGGVYVETDDEKMYEIPENVTEDDLAEMAKESLEIGEDLIRKNFARKELLYEETPDVRI